jgi:FemAB-related protein (PEP-CTERM system-associated)
MSAAADGLIIERLQTKGRLEADWDAFVEAHAEATFFHRAGWRRVVEHGYAQPTHYLIALRSGDVCGVLPLVEIRSRLFGNALISTGFSVYGGIVAADKEAATHLADAAVQLGETLGIDYVELRGSSIAIDDWIAKAGVYATFVRRLSADEAESLNAIPRKKRADLRKAQKSDLRVEGADVGAFHRMYAVSMRNHGTPVFPLRFFEALLAEFRDAVEISAVRGADGPLASLISFYTTTTVLPYYAAVLPVARAAHACDLLYWSLMRRASERGIVWFDFGRSKIGTGAYDYKRFWGFEPTPLRYQYRLIRGRKVPELNPLNPKYRMMVECWRRLPLPVANTLGPWIARQLG